MVVYRNQADELTQRRTRETAAAVTDELGDDDGAFGLRAVDIVVKANVEETSGPDVLFIPMHFVHGTVNYRTSEEFDAMGKIPQYKCRTSA